MVTGGTLLKRYVYLTFYYVTNQHYSTVFLSYLNLLAVCLDSTIFLVKLINVIEKKITSIMFESPLVRVNIILSINFKFYQTIFRISLDQVQGMETSVAAQLLPPSHKLQQLPVHQLPALLPPSHQLQQLPGHQLPHLYLHTAPHHHLHPIHTGKSVINGRTHSIVLANIPEGRLFAKTDIASALVKATTTTLACVSCFLVISIDQVE